MPKKSKTFEETYEQLLLKINMLEAGNLSLDESIKIYEEATELSSECQQFLKNAKIKLDSINDKKEEVNE